MRIIIFLLAIITITILFGCKSSNTGAFESNPVQEVEGEAEILHSWNGDYPVAQLNLLPEKQREQAVGFIDDAEIFEGLWEALKPGEEVPEIDFKANLVLFARNTQFYNRISIGKVNLKSGVAELLAMETMSAMPIEDKVGMSLVMVSRTGIKSVRTPDGLVSIYD